MFKNFKFFKSLIPTSTSVADSSGTVQAHLQERTLYEKIYYPTTKGSEDE